MPFHKLIESANLNEATELTIYILIVLFVLSVIALYIQHLRRKVVRRRIKKIRKRKTISKQHKRSKAR